MRALLVVRPDAPAKPGGDLVHAERTATALRALGADADVVATLAPDPRGYDVAHVFGVFEPATARAQIDAVKAHGTPLALSPIWLDLRAFFATSPHVERALAARTAAEVERRLAKLHRVEAQLPWRGSVARNADRRLDAQRALVLRSRRGAARERGGGVPLRRAPARRGRAVRGRAAGRRRRRVRGRAAARARRRAVRGAHRAEEESSRAAVRAARRRTSTSRSSATRTTRATSRCAGAGRRRARASSSTRRTTS